eukprot:PhF_6_TR1580/c0_g1_i1/m.2872/K10256/FAD2; omega-6 fatty acid desaturase / acyl-lipid omega-6 desaturase (Delta-12 desaturase)
MSTKKSDVEILPMPPFTLKELRDCIPPSLFEYSLVKSFGYLFHDIALSVIITGLAMKALTYVSPWIVFPLYWIAQGCVWTGLWVLAHECGHGGFSKYRWVNNIVGTILHSFLLVPFHSWRISHATHHKSTNHTERDSVFVPSISDDDIAPVAPIQSLISIVVMLTLGWPGYLLFNLSGQNYKRRTNHFEPSSPIFQPADKYYVIESNIALVAVLGCIMSAVYSYGFANVAAWYGVPYLIVNFWLVFITFLQHTDVRLPHYKGEEWSFIRGALCTVDRDYGFVLNYIFHHITDSHVVHHCFSKMPFYNAIQATPYVKQFAKKYYVEDHRPIFQCLWESTTKCQAIGSGNAELYRS